MYAELHYFMTIRWNSSSQHVRQLALSCILNLRTHSQLPIELHDSLHDSELRNSHSTVQLYPTTVLLPMICTSTGTVHVRVLHLVQLFYLQPYDTYIHKEL